MKNSKLSNSTIVVLYEWETVLYCIEAIVSKKTFFLLYRSGIVTVPLPTHAKMTVTDQGLMT